MSDGFAYRFVGSQPTTITEVHLVGGANFHAEPGQVYELDQPTDDGRFEWAGEGDAPAAAVPHGAVATATAAPSIVFAEAPSEPQEPSEEPPYGVVLIEDAESAEG